MLSDESIMNSLIVLGKILGVIPSHLANYLQKMYTIILLSTLLLLSLTANYYRLRLYQTFAPMKLFNNILIEVHLYLFPFLTITNALFWTKNEGYAILEIIKINRQHFGWKYVFNQIAYWALVLFAIGVWINVEGIDYFKEYAVDVILFSYQFYTGYFISIILRALSTGYEHINQKLKSSDFQLQNLEEQVVLLKNLVDKFNKIFGLPIVCIAITTVVTTVDFLDDIFKNSYDYSCKEYFTIVTANVITISMCLVINNVQFLKLYLIMHF